MSEAPKFRIVDAETFTEVEAENIASGDDGITYIYVNCASSMKRFINAIVDRICVYIVLIFFQTGLLVAGGSSSIYSLLITICATVVYYAFFEMLTQRTPGKIFTGTVVIDEFGNKPSFETLMIRSMTRLIPFDALSFLGGGRGWHDKWSKTFVIHTSEMNEIKTLMEMEKIGEPEQIREDMDDSSETNH